MIKKNAFKRPVVAIAVITIIGCIFFANDKGIFNISKNYIPRINASDEKPVIFENVNSQLDKDIKFTNGWKSELIEGERFIIVQVGSLKADPAQGVAFVGQQSKDGNKFVTGGKILTPSKHGTIKIKNFNSFNLGVVAEDGYEWIFNVFDGFHEIPQ